MVKSIFFPPSHQEFLHSKNYLHGNIRARGVLVTKEFTAKLWGLHGVYMRNNKGASQREDPSMKKWQAPEVLAKRIPGQSSDMWVFHLHLYTHLFSLSHCCCVSIYLFLQCFYWETLNVYPHLSFQLVFWHFTVWNGNTWYVYLCPWYHFLSVL